MYPDNLKYSKEHEWVKADGRIATIGITHYAQDSLGDIVYVELPPLGKEFKARQEFGVAESVKSVSSLYTPVSGKIVARNDALDGKPQLVNDSPYGEGWIIKVEMSDPAEVNALLSAADYQKILK
ncbi:MAG: glycine cleavage system protein GcvH [Candidatus Margulisiibacteriota bacterium]